MYSSLRTALAAQLPQCAQQCAAFTAFVSEYSSLLQLYGWQPAT
jgi:hypothetical protein